MKKRVMLDKKIGETPLQALTAWRARHPRYRDIPASYAGRLDPMASGKLLILLGEECKRQKEYTGLDKDYEIEVLLDIGSDTGDILGIVERSEQEISPERSAIAALIKDEIGTHTRAYPRYSSKTVQGKPLFLYALEGHADDIKIPVHDETIHAIRYRGSYSITTAKLRERVASLLALAPVSDEPSKTLGADFRIEAVTKSWERALDIEREYRVLKLKVACGSGTYMRSLAERIGVALNTRALALSIRRTRIRL